MKRTEAVIVKCVRKLLMFIVAGSIACIPFLSSHAVESGDTVDSSNYSGYIMDTYERLGADRQDNTLGVPSFYDPRNLSYTTPNKIQGESNLCWLYATTGMAETFVSKNYGTKFDVSSSHGAVAMSNAVGKSKNNVGYYLNNPDCGGNNVKAFQYLTNWNSPIFNNKNAVQWNSIISENNYPLSDFMDDSTQYLNDGFSNSKSLFNITSMTYLNPRDIDGIKLAIKEYGAVTTGISTYCPQNKYVDSNGDINFYSDSNPPALNHAVMLVGWDDKYSKNNFSPTLSDKITSDGAWLVKNTYEDEKYFWLSYQDGFLNNKNNNVAVITGVKRADSNQKMLSYDYFPVAFNSKCYYRDDLYLCNIYDVSQYTDIYDQIDDVMFYLRSSGCRYELKVIPIEENSLPQNIDEYKTVSNGTFNGEGYITASFTDPYMIGSASKYAFVLHLSPLSSSSRIYIPYEGIGDYNLLNSNIENYPEINSSESYYGTSENNVIDWKDCNVDTSYCDNLVKGNLIIRPVLSKSDSSVGDSVTLEPNSITSINENANIKISGNLSFFSIYTSDNRILREGVDYVRTENGITINATFLKTLGNNYTEIIFEFNDNINKKVIVNPKADITNIKIVGDPIVGEKLTAKIEGLPEKDKYLVDYQWQSSINGVSWTNISGAYTKEYTVTENDFRRYIRVRVKARKNGNVIYPTIKYSEPTKFKVVILGDVNLDGNVSIQDATLVSKHIVKLITLTDEQILAADVDHDGVINITDSTLIQKMI